MITVGHIMNGRWVVLAVAARRGELDTVEGDRNAVAHDLVLLAVAADDGEYVTARGHSDRDRSWYWGHYFPPSEAAEAWRDYIDRLEVLTERVSAP